MPTTVDDIKDTIAPRPLRARLLDEARDTTCGPREADYGDPVANMEHIARIASAITRRQMSAAEIVAVHMATKLARMATSPLKEDHYLDLMAYAGILAEVRVSAKNWSPYTENAFPEAVAAPGQREDQTDAHSGY